MPMSLRSDGVTSIPQTTGSTGLYSVLVQTDRPIEVEARAAHHIAPEDLRDGVPPSWWREYLACNGPVA